ncbi:hypothetical protein HPG69_007257, partial [Diceros bicornis minor]
TVAAFGLKSSLNDAECKFVFCLHRVLMVVSLSTTCLLSGFQAIKLNSSFSSSMEPRIRSPKCFEVCCSICWVLHLLLNVYYYECNWPKEQQKHEPSRKARATCAILILVSMFISLHCPSAILSFWMTQAVNPHHWLMNTSALVSLGLPTFSPLVFILSDTCISKFCFVCSQRTQMLQAWSLGQKFLQNIPPFTGLLFSTFLGLHARTLRFSIE